jgi:predicted O-methyltransferase YrrM
VNDKHWTRIDAIPGWLTRPQAEALEALARPAEVVVELGSWVGRSTAALALGCRRGTVYAVDHHRGSPSERGGPHRIALELPDGTYPDFLRNMQRLELLGDAVIPLLGDFEAVARNFHRRVDLLFLDGEHTHEATVAAYRAWAPLLQPRAVVVFHDYCWPGVQHALATLELTHTVRHDLAIHERT